MLPGPAGAVEQDDAITPVDAPRVMERVGKTKGTFTDLREAYEGNRAGIPWRDTRAQELIGKLAGSAVKGLLPEDRAGTLEALASYGKRATQFLIARGVKIGTRRKTEVVMTQDELTQVYDSVGAQRWLEQDVRQMSYRPLPADYGFRVERGYGRATPLAPDPSAFAHRWRTRMWSVLPSC